ncbi:MAG TPA: SagB family peptide dehydrogenase [Vicinamibacterales bacterium]|nr:SagB family peptide dehydrogenase [Vicinamibacterales bacterium]
MAVRAEIRVRRTPHLVLYWRTGSLIVCNYATGELIEATPDVCSVLDYCGAWRTASAIARSLGIGRTLAARLVASLTARGLLQRADRPADPRDRAMSVLDEWNPSAGFFHTATRRVRFLSARQAARLSRRRASTRVTPPAVKRLSRASTIRLPPPDTAGQFPQVLLRRRTWRRFGSGPVLAADLATTLGLALGVQQWVPTAFGRLPLKTSPSGGARHPIEAYVCVRRVTGIAPGLYHYAADVHGLEQMRLGDLTARARAWMPHSEYFAKASFLIVLTAVLEREIWRYPYPRAYRAAIAEAGHVCQTFCLAATWRNLAPFCLMGLDDALIERELGIDGVRETVLYVAGAGRPPRGADWAPRVRGTLRSRPNPAFRPS